jgi:putative heme-binding domain-containing protein
VFARAFVFLVPVGALFAQQPLGGDVQRGKELFEGKGQCAACHRVNGNGSRLGPDLSEIGTQRRTPGTDVSIPLAKSLEQSILDPDAEVLRENRYVRVVMKDGKTTVTGRLLNLDNWTVQLRDPQDKLRSFLRSDLREATILTKSLMPSYQDKLSAQELADVVAYLLTLKKAE